CCTFLASITHGSPCSSRASTSGSPVSPARSSKTSSPDGWSRRGFLAALPALGLASTRLIAGQPVRRSFSEGGPRPFRIDIPPSTISRILKRVKEARWPDRLDSTDWRYGANWDYMKGLAEYWTTKYDW